MPVMRLPPRPAGRLEERLAVLVELLFDLLEKFVARFAAQSVAELRLVAEIEGHVRWHAHTTVSCTIRACFTRDVVPCGDTRRWLGISARKSVSLWPRLRTSPPREEQLFAPAPCEVLRATESSRRIEARVIKAGACAPRRFTLFETVQRSSGASPVCAPPAGFLQI